MATIRDVPDDVYEEYRRQARGRSVAAGPTRGDRLFAPHLIDAKVGSVLRRRVAAGAVLLRENLTFYDALHVALAMRLAVPLITPDARLARSPGLPCDVEVIS